MNLNYYSPTPKKWRKIGDAFFSVFTFVSACGVYMENDIVVIAAFSCGIVGKFITNLYSDGE